MLNWTYQLRATRRGVSKKKKVEQKRAIWRVLGQERSRTCRAEKNIKEPNRLTSCIETEKVKAFLL